MLPSGGRSHTVSLSRVTLRDGSTWLVHKGDGFGISSQTVVVDARHMSTSWQVRCPKSVYLFRGVSMGGRAQGRTCPPINDGLGLFELMNKTCHTHCISLDTVAVDLRWSLCFFVFPKKKYKCLKIFQIMFHVSRFWKQKISGGPRRWVILSGLAAPTTACSSITVTSGQVG